MSKGNARIRTYDPELDDLVELAIFYHNSFIHVASHNWFNQSIEAVEEIPTGTLISSLTYSQSTRLHFYSCVINSTIYGGGIIKIVHPLNSSNAILGAVMFLPPNERFQPLTLNGLYQTGFLKLIWRWKYQSRRILFFEAEVERLEHIAVTQKSEQGPTFPIRRAEEALLVVLLAIAESERSKGLARDLIYEGEKLFPNTPVLLDTADYRTMSVYKRYGFKLVEETRLAQHECDRDGYKLKGGENNDSEDRLNLYIMMKWD